MLLLFLVLLEPFETIELPGIFGLIKIFNNQIYLAPNFGKSIYLFDKQQKPIPITFTDDINYRIRNFFVTPFAIYLNNGKSLEKFYFATGTKETIYADDNISSFIVTTNEEIVLANQRSNELIFMDFKNVAKFIKENIVIKDLHMANGIIYALTNKNIKFLDEFGNFIGEKAIPEKLEHIYVDSVTIYLFSSNKPYIYRLQEKWEKMELSTSISDMTFDAQNFIILDSDGNTLYFYNKSDF